MYYSLRYSRPTNRLTHLYRLVSGKLKKRKKPLTSMGRHLSARYGHVILVGGYPVLSADQNMDGQYSQQASH